MSTFSTLPGVLNIAIVQGDTFSCDLDFTSDLTGYTVVSEVYAVPHGDTVKEITVTPVALNEGRLTISLTAEETALIPRGTYRWKASWTSPSSEARMVLYGFFEVSG
jgi:hypothetical protein